jgi:hypothetical protein
MPRRNGIIVTAVLRIGRGITTKHSQEANARRYIRLAAEGSIKVKVKGMYQASKLQHSYVNKVYLLIQLLILTLLALSDVVAFHSALYLVMKPQREPQSSRLFALDTKT